MVTPKKKAPWLLSMLLVAAVGCSDDPDDFNRDKGVDGISQDMASTQNDLGQADTRTVDSARPAADAMDDVTANDGTTSCPLLEWGSDGGLVLYRDGYRLEDCKDFTLTRTNTGSDPNPVSCKTTVEAENANLKAILSTLAQADVQQALTSGTPFYGKDERPVDGPAFKLMVGDKTLLVGSACTGGSGCVAIPAGLTTLITQLSALTAEQRSKPACSALKTP